MRFKKYLKNNTIRSFANLFDFQEIFDSRHFRHSCRFLSRVCSCIHSKKYPRMIVFIARKSKENSTLSFFRAVFKWQNKDKNDLESAMLFLTNIKNRKICDFDFKKNIFNEMYDFERKMYLKKF